MSRNKARPKQTKKKQDPLTSVIKPSSSSQEPATVLLPGTQAAKPNDIAQNTQSAKALISQSKHNASSSIQAIANTDQSIAIAGNVNQVAAAIPSAVQETKKEGKKAPEEQTLISKFWRHILTGLIGVFEGIIYAVVFKTAQIPSSWPLADLLNQTSILSVMGGIVFVIGVISIIVSRRPLAKSGQQPIVAVLRSIFATVFPVCGYVLFSLLFMLDIFRPSFCPQLLCPAPQTMVLTTTDSTYDTHLEVYFLDIQSSSYVIPSDPTKYTLNTLPKQISAVRADSLHPPYRVVLGIHSLQRDGAGLIIEEIALVVKDIPITPYPLHVWNEAAPLLYQTNIYKAVYDGQMVNVPFPATYMQVPSGLVQLKAGEADTIDVEVNAHTAVDLRFQVSVTYQIAGDKSEHKLLFPQIFEVIFSTKDNWNLYHFQKNHFLAGP